MSITKTRELTSQTRIAVIGDVHGHADALERLLAELSVYAPDAHLAFVGDVSHKGPDSVAVYRRVLDMVDRGAATMVASNHGFADGLRLGQALRRYGNIVDAAVGLYDRAAELPPHATMWHVARLAGDLAGERDGDVLAERIVAAQTAAPLQAKFGSSLVVVHGGLTPETYGSTGRKARQVCLYGTPTGLDDRGRPVARDSWVPLWQQARRKNPSLPVVAYGHISYDEPSVTDSTIGVDTGCGSTRPEAKLSAALWVDASSPVEFVSVSARLSDEAF